MSHTLYPEDLNRLTKEDLEDLVDQQLIKRIDASIIILDREYPIKNGSPTELPNDYEQISKSVKKQIIDFDIETSQKIEGEEAKNLYMHIKYMKMQRESVLMSLTEIDFGEQMNEDLEEFASDLLKYINYYMERFFELS